MATFIFFHPQFSQSKHIVTKSGTKNITKLDTPSVTKTEHTKDIFKDKINTPLPPTGESVKGGKPSKRKSNPIKYDDYLNAYNEAVGDRLPHAVEANDERKQKLAALVKSLATPNLDGFRSYVRAFMACCQARSTLATTIAAGWLILITCFNARR
ncbi:MAG: hypothetical protein ACR5LC_13910 [Symbiopectobacterium sp.]|uniref:hypothetical protein n=1 Tax=Symbiopectobacterium sp. TaxID=2952789 RepID=UPI003F3070E4